MTAYTTLDYLPDLSMVGMANARALSFSPYSPTLSSITWDSRAFYSTSTFTGNSAFRWTGSQGASYDFFSTSYYDPSYIRIYDAQGNAVATDGESLLDAIGSDTLFSFVAPYSGTFYVDAGWNQSLSNSYATVSIYEDLGSIVTPQRDDYPDNTSTTGLLSIGSQSNGNIETAGDEDWFRISLLAGTTYTFELNGRDGNGGTLGSNNFESPYLTLYDSLGFYRSSAYTGGTDGDPLLTFTPSNSGIYYLAAEELFGTGTGTYTLRASGTTISDDQSDTTATTGSVAIGGQTTGTIERANDQDWFRVQLQAGTSYTFELRGADSGGGTLGSGWSEAYLSLYDSQGFYRTAAANGGNAGDPLIAFTPITSGTYYLGVDELFGTGTGTYTLRASVATVPTDDHRADTTTTGTIAPGGSTTGAIEQAGDTDWFGINLDAGTRYSISLNGNPGSGLSDPYLRLYTSAGNLLTFDDDSGEGLNALLSYTPATTGRYFIEASSATFLSQQTGRYTLQVSATSAAADDHAAGIQTTSTVIPGTRATGRIETTGDHDWFRVQLTAGTPYNIQLDSGNTPGLSDPYLRLYDSAGLQIASDDDSGSGLNALLSFTPSVSGNYYLGASSAGIFGSSSGHYTLSVDTATVNADDYTDTTATTGRISAGNTTTGHIETPGDHDWFAIILNAATTYSLQLQGARDNGLYDPYLRVYNSSGTLLAFDDDSGDGLDAQLQFTPAASATYYIDASSATYFSSTTGRYSLTVNPTGNAVDDYTADTATTGQARAGSSISGKIDTPGDHDWFGITLTAGTTYTFNLDTRASGGLTDPYLRLRNHSGTQIAQDDDSGPGLDAQLTYTPTTTGTYYLDASSSTYFPNLTGQYTLRVNSTMATPNPGSATGFNIDVRYTGDPQYQAAFTHAATRWQSIITNDLPDIQNFQYGLIDDLLITASVASIDGPGAILGQARPTAIRPDSGLPYLGEMHFDAADIATLVANGTLEDVILHEMGHVLGIGCLWQNGNLINPDNNSQYIGQQALSAWRNLSGNTNASYVPLETSGGLGTAGVHWSETIFDSELMTGYVNNDMPVSIVTIGTLADLGYSVNYSQADTFTLA